MIADILAGHVRKGFLVGWLKARGVGWASDLIPNLTNLAPDEEYRPTITQPSGPEAVVTDAAMAEATRGADPETEPAGNEAEYAETEAVPILKEAKEEAAS